MGTLPTMEYAGDIDLDAEVVHDAHTGVRLTNEVIDRMNDGEDSRWLRRTVEEKLAA